MKKSQREESEETWEWRFEEEELVGISGMYVCMYLL